MMLEVVPVEGFVGASFALSRLPSTVFHLSAVLCHLPSNVATPLGDDPASTSDGSNATIESP
jgi:hypothetical protein